MAKTWKDIEFLDYKERQVRRRSQKTRELEQVLTGNTNEKSKLVGIAVGGVFFLALLVGGIVAHRHYGDLLLTTDAARSVLRVWKVSGTVEISSGGSAWERVKQGAKIGAGTHIRTGEGSKVVLKPAIPNSRILLFPESVLIFEKIQLAQSNNQSAAFNFEIEKGEAVFDFQGGAPICMVDLPLISIGAQKVRFKARITGDENRVLVSHFAAQAQDRSDPSKKVVVPAGQQIVSTLSGPFPKPKGAKDVILREDWY